MLGDEAAKLDGMLSEEGILSGFGAAEDGDAPGVHIAVKLKLFPNLEDAFFAVVHLCDRLFSLVAGGSLAYVPSFEQ
jgi:hypothetical protein